MFSAILNKNFKRPLMRVYFKVRVIIRARTSFRVKGRVSFVVGFGLALGVPRIRVGIRDRYMANIVLRLLRLL